MNAMSKMTIRAAAIRTVPMLRLTITYSSLPLIFIPIRAAHKGTLRAPESNAAAWQPLPLCSFKQKYVTDHSSMQLSARIFCAIDESHRLTSPSSRLAGCVDHQPSPNPLTESLSTRELSSIADK
jgi:hypothetical protein